MATPKKPKPHLPLIDELKMLLEARRGEWQKIADESDLVSHSWISQFMRGLIKNPGYGTLVELRDYLLLHPAAAEQAEKAA